MSATLPGLTDLAGGLERRPGGFNWPDMEIVIDPKQTAIEDDAIYLVQIQDREPVVKRCRDQGSSIRLMPALATVHGQESVSLFGRRIPAQTVEFTDSIYKHAVTVHGRVVGLWAGVQSGQST